MTVEDASNLATPPDAGALAASTKSPSSVRTFSLDEDTKLWIHERYQRIIKALAFLVFFSTISLIMAAVHFVYQSIASTDPAAWLGNIASILNVVLQITLASILIAETIETGWWVIRNTYKDVTTGNR